MTNFDFTAFLNLIITILSAVITLFIIPYLKKKLSNEKFEELIKHTQIAVGAAEQLFGSGMGEEKKKYVTDYLRSKGIVVDIDEVLNIIENEVLKLKVQDFKKDSIEVSEVDAE